MTLRTAISEFLSHCRFEKNLSAKTLKAYHIDLLQFQVFLLTRNPVMIVAEVSKHELRDYLASISSLKPKSIKRKIAVIKTLFNYLEFEDRILINLLRKMCIKIKEPQRLPTVMDLPEIVKIFKSGYKLKDQIKNEHSYSYLESLRNIVILELLFSTGARVSEIANLHKDFINLQSGSITIKGIIQVCNKETLDTLKNYYALFKDKIETAGGAFLINRFSNKLSDQSIRNMVKSIAHKAGIKKHITPACANTITVCYRKTLHRK